MVDVRQIDLRFGLGGVIMDSEIVEDQAETMSFPIAWLRMITTSPTDMLYWARGMGNSMEPAIGDGDVILIDRSQFDVGFGDLYWAISYGQIGMIKRLRPMPDGGVKILSDNPAVTPETAYDGELHVFGRVVAVVKRL
jgi:phage repressor protein C with HTH and peptisase S24 domain